MHQSLPILALSLWLTSGVAASEPLPAEKAKVAQYLVRGLRANREKLVSGAFSAYGQKTLSFRTGERVHGDVEIFMAFDYIAQRLRIDRTEPNLVRRSPQYVPVRAIEGGKYARTPSSTSIWTRDSSGALTEKNGGERAPLTINPFDVRTLGLTPLLSMEREISLDSAMKIYADNTPIDVVEDAPGVFHLKWSAAIPNVGLQSVQELWIDERRGFSPVRADWHVLNPNEAPEKRYYQRCTAQLSWELVDDCWVPSTFLIHDDRPNKVSLEYSLVLKWTSVNKPIPDTVFSPEGFNLPQGTQLINTELGRPVVTGVVGGGRPPADDLEYIPLSEIQQRRWWSEHWLYVVAGGLSAAILLWMIVHFRRRRAVAKLPT